MAGRGLATGAVLLAALGATALPAGEDRGLERAVAAWVASLDRGQRGDALHRFDDEERFDLRLAPLGLEGLRRDEMRRGQWDSWLAAMGTTLSDSGLAKVRDIVWLERQVRRRDREAGVLRGWFGGFVHGEHRYYASVFGDPAAGPPWALRFDGHHLSLNWTVPEAGQLSVTPVFLGAEPREVPRGQERAGLRVLAEEEDRAYALWGLLSREDRARAELPFEHASGAAGQNRPLFLGEPALLVAPEPQGVARSALGPGARAALDALIETYLANFSEAVAAELRAALDAAGRDAIRFAWSGSLVPGSAGYYRVQGPTFLIEFDNTLPEADHVHAVLREFDGDFGRDLLAEHYERRHGTQLAGVRSADAP